MQLVIYSLISRDFGINQISCKCNTRVSQSLFFGHVGTADLKILQKQELFARFSGKRTWTHNPKVARCAQVLPSLLKKTTMNSWSLHLRFGWLQGRGTAEQPNVEVINIQRTHDIPFEG